MHVISGVQVVLFRVGSKNLLVREEVKVRRLYEGVPIKDRICDLLLYHCIIVITRIEEIMVNLESDEHVDIEREVRG